MSKAERDEMLARIRAAIGNPRRSESARNALEERMKAPPSGPHPQAAGGELDRFIAKAKSNLFTVERIASLQLLVPAIRELLSARAAPLDISVAPALANLGWPAEWSVNIGPGRMVEPLSVTLAVAGIAETGAVVLRSNGSNPTTLNFLPDTHVVVLRTADIVAHAEDVWARMRAGREDWPRVVNLIAGPSRTADVGGIIVRPAHGPKDVRLILVES